MFKITEIIFQSLYWVCIAIIYGNIIVNATTEYPLYAIVSGKTVFSDNDIKVIANNFHAMQSKLNESTSKLLHSYNPQFKLVQYENSHIATPYQVAESNKNDIAKYPFAVLTKPLSNNINDNIIYLQLINKFNHSNSIPILPSNIDGNYSLNCQKYISFIEINTEYMKVLSIKNIGNSLYTLNIIRGFIDNPIISHPINSSLFAPVYTHPTPATPNCSTLRYGINIESQFAISSLVNATVASINSGYDGSWYDCFSQSLFKESTMTDKKLDISQIWSDNMQTFYSCTTFRQQQQTRLTAVWTQLSKYGYNVNNITIFANNMNSNGYYECGTRELLIADPPNFPKPLDGYSMEAYSMNEGGTCTNATMGFINPKSWIKNVGDLINASYSKINALPMIANAGCYSIGLESLNNTYYNQLLLFGYTSFLLGVDKRDTTVKFGMPAMRYVNNGKGPRQAVVNEIFRYKIGDPIQSFKNVSEYQIKGHCSYWRVFENGIILVNPQLNETDYNINLNKSYINPKNNKTMQYNITLQSLSGLILLNN
eukprot:465558_1